MAKNIKNIKNTNDYSITYKSQAEARAAAGNVPVFCSYDKLVNPMDLTGNPRNPNTHPDEQVKLLAYIIQSQGWRAPITVSSRSGFIVRGHGRLAAALYFGAELVPVDYQNYGSEAEEWADLVADNRLAELSEIDDIKLAELIKELDTGELPLILSGYDGDLIEELINSLSNEEYIPDGDDDEIPDVPETPITQTGDIWILGEHRLMCGDSEKAADVLRLMDGEKARCVFTDPPWNVDYGSDTRHPSWKPRQILNDNMSAEKFGSFLASAFKCMAAVSEPGCMTYVVMSAQEWGNVMSAMRGAGYRWSSTIIWAKDSFVLSRKDYHTQYEPVWYGWLGPDKRLRPLTDRKQSDLWEIPRPKKSGEHPTMKPVELAVRVLQNSSRIGDAVLDLFGGSGTTMIAAERTGRRAFLMELDEKYCDVTVGRYINITGNENIYCIRGGQNNKFSKAEFGYAQLHGETEENKGG